MRVHFGAGDYAIGSDHGADWHRGVQDGAAIKTVRSFVRFYIERLRIVGKPQPEPEGRAEAADDAWRTVAKIG